jgi:hypothetical protein
MPEAPRMTVDGENQLSASWYTQPARPGMGPYIPNVVANSRKVLFPAALRVSANRASSARSLASRWAVLSYN